MKKILAVILSVTMAFSLCVAGFAAELRVSPAEGKIYVAAQCEHIKAGQTYDVPISLVSNIDVKDASGNAVTTGAFYLGFKAAVATGAEQQYVTVTAIKPSDELKATKGYSQGDSVMYNTAENQDGSIDYSNAEADFSFKTEDLSILHNDNFVVAYVTIKVADNYPGGEVMNDIITDAYDISFSDDGSFMTTDNWAYTSGICAVVPTDSETAIELTFATDVNTDQLVFEAGHLAEKFSWDPLPEPTLKEKIIAFLEKAALKIVDFLITGLTAVRSLLIKEIG